VHCAHGILPVPAPATAYILQGVPIYGGQIQAELCTPTGAALLKHFAKGFGAMPIMNTEKTGYGMGNKDFAQANCVRAFWGETQSDYKRIVPDNGGKEETAFELSTNLDDMTGEEIAFASKRLFKAGALDVWTVSAQMKKGRPGVVLSVLCKEEKKEAVIQAFFRHTSTIGIRENKVKRYVLDREILTANTEYGKVHFKKSSGYGTEKKKAEFEDLKEIALKKGLSIQEIKEKL
ncbi:MAG: LarC family nickel insertion protein, partial [Lachnospiraceae bacterium]|nr:LarC family nickel insertion protein [Lachnospiraceae bacterium]